MSKRTKVIVIVIVGLGMVIVAATWYSLRTIDYAGWIMRRQIEGGQVRIFCKSDPAALLGACRELSKRIASGEVRAGSFRVGRSPGRVASSFPKPILVLRPREVILGEDGTVKLSMYTGWRPFGLWACPEGYEGARPETARRKLLDGLWYYDDEYGHYGAAVDEAIDALIEAHCPGAN